VQVNLKGPQGRAKGTILIAFARADRLRVELPGSAGARMILVTRGEQLAAVFPGERAYYAGAAEAATFETILGVALAPPAIMDLLLGRGSDSVTIHSIRQGAVAPRHVAGRLRDGTRIALSIQDATINPALAPQAFEFVAPRGFRVIDELEARALCGLSPRPVDEGRR
jgi:hypothetical protein